MIKHYKLFESTYDIEKTCDRYGIKGWTINPETGLVDVNGSVLIKKLGLKKLPLEFGKVMGNFMCSYQGLTTLEGAPHTVEGYFDCDNNQLTDLKGAPDSIGRYFSCENNKLTTLEGLSSRLLNSLYCRKNNIRDFYGILEGALGSKGGQNFELDCSGNPIHEICTLFRYHVGNTNIKFIYLINEYKVIYKGKWIIYDRLIEVYDHLGLAIPKQTQLQFNEYQLIH